VSNITKHNRGSSLRFVVMLALYLVVTGTIQAAPPPAFESGMPYRVKGSASWSGDKQVVHDERTGESFLLVGFDKSKDAPVDEYEGVLSVVVGEDGSTSFELLSTAADVQPQHSENVRERLLSLKRASDLWRDSTSVNPYDGITAPYAVQRELTVFLRAWQKYHGKVYDELARLYGVSSPRALPAYLNFNVITKRNRAANRKFKSNYDAAISACNTYVAACKSSGIWQGINTSPKGTYIHMDKRTGLIRVVNRRNGETLFCAPFAFGGNPDGVNKRRNGDFRTPGVSASKATAATTPFYVGRRAPHTVAAGMTTRAMGVWSDNRSDKFWVASGMNIAIHGTPAKWSMGLRASHGCCRVLDNHVIHVYALTAKGTRIVIRSL